MEENKQNVQNGVNNSNEKKTEGNKVRTVILIVILAIVMLIVGVSAGIIFSKNNPTIINQTQSEKKDEAEKKADKNKIIGDDSNGSSDLENLNNSNNESKSDDSNNSSKSDDSKPNTTSSGDVNTNNNTENNKVINEKDFINTWETVSKDTEIKLYENGTFVKDNYTTASKIKGTYKIKDNYIEFTTDDGKKWNGIMLIQSGEFVLNINIDGKEINLYDLSNHISTEKTDDTNTETELSVKGKYENKSVSDEYYHDATIEITDQGESIIEFKINAVRWYGY